MVVARIIVETSIILQYLVKNLDDSLCEKIIKSSLAYDKKLYDFIEQNRGDKPLTDIENRMLNSIKNNFKKENIQIDDINFQNDKNWGQTYILWLPK